LKRAYKLSAAADHDLLEIWSYVFNQANGLTRADRVVDSLYESFEFLARFPDAGKQAPRLGADIWTFPKRGYLIAYRVCAEGIEVARVSGAHEGVLDLI
jgi:plasmid stabilization system protein ParE